MIIHPIILFQEMVSGAMHWNDEYQSSEAAAMLEMLNPTLPGLNPEASLSEYEQALEPV